MSADQRTSPLDVEVASELSAIDEALAAAFGALREANQRGISGTDADDLSARFELVESRTAAVKLQVWPRYRGTLVVAMGTALLVSPTGRSVRTVWERPRDGEHAEHGAASRSVDSPSAVTAPMPRGR